MQKLDLQTLESKLWSCANVLRGKLDSAVYKDYIIGLMFFKRIRFASLLDQRIYTWVVLLIDIFKAERSLILFLNLQGF